MSESEMETKTPQAIERDDPTRFLVPSASRFGSGLCLISQAQFEPGTIVCAFGAAAILRSPDRLSLQVDDERHIYLLPECLQYINHSCEPNVFFDVASRNLRTLTPIARGDELTAFYPATEWDMANGFECRCNVGHCLRRIDGAKHIATERLRSYRLSAHIEARLE